MVGMLRAATSLAAALLSIQQVASLPLRDKSPQSLRIDHEGAPAEEGEENSMLQQVSHLAWEPARAMNQGVELLGAEAQVMRQTLSKAVTQSAGKLEDGDLQGAWRVASDAVTEVDAKTASLKVNFGRTAALSASIIVLVSAIGILWGLEHLISNTRTTQGTQAPSEAAGCEDSLHLPALDFLRYLLSFMMLLYNFYPWTVDSVQGRWANLTASFASWGILAAPLFFVLSGFSHSYTKLIAKMKAEAESMGPAPKTAEVKEDMLCAMIVRVMVWYPYYLLVLVFLATHYLSFNAEDWSSFMAQLFLIGGAFLEHETVYFPFFPSSWWFSYLMVYLLAWLPMHQVLAESDSSVIWTMFSMATIACFPSVLLEWIWFDAYAPYILIQYSPSFFFGQALAVWQVRNCMAIKIPDGKPVFTRHAEDELSFSARFGVTASVLILGVIMILTCVYDRMAIFGMPCTSFFTKGLLLPVFGMLIVGLANEVDPLAKLVSRKPICYLGCLSLSQFMLALPVHIAVDHYTGQSGFSFFFVFCLTLASIVGYHCIEKPSRRLSALLRLRLRDSEPAQAFLGASASSQPTNLRGLSKSSS